MADMYERLARAIKNIWLGQATEAEEYEFRKWLAASPENVRWWINQFKDEERVAAEIICFHNSDREAHRQLLWEMIDTHERQQIDTQEIQTGAPAYKIERSRRLYTWLCAAVVAGIVVGVWWISSTKHRSAGDLVKNDSMQIEYRDTSDIVFESSNGHKYDMRQLGDSLLTEQGDYAFFRRNQKLVIRLLPENRRKQVKGFNKLTVSAGGRCEVELPDSSRVWLNAASSIAIASNADSRFRRVTINGEAYFEVTTNAQRPFIVQLPDTTSAVEVKGTVFNITAYPGETVKTTLIEGSLSVIKRSQKRRIKKGQQAQLSDNGIDVIDEVDTDQVTAWKKGYFEFEDKDLTSVVREIARWYNLEPYYIDTPTVSVSYSDSRDMPVEITLQQIRAGNSKIKLYREGRRIVVRR